MPASLAEYEVKVLDGFRRFREYPDGKKELENVTYGWLRRAKEAPRLVPLTISTQAEFKKKVYWCRGQFTNYRIFSSRAQLLANGQTQGPAEQRGPASNQ